MFEPTDWMLDQLCSMMHHRPTHTHYLLSYDKTKAAEYLTIFDMITRLNHVCASNSMPPPNQIIELGRAASMVFLIETGAWEGRVEDVDELYLST